jgi:hypothetical protein
MMAAISQVANPWPFLRLMRIARSVASTTVGPTGTADHAVAQLGHPLGQIIHGETEGQRRYLLRGLTKVNGEWLLWGLTHNINKLWHHQKPRRCQEAMATG